jgi:hypothetical protein
LAEVTLNSSMGNVLFRSAPARIPETLDQFSDDLISLDRFGSKADITSTSRLGLIAVQDALVVGSRRRFLPEPRVRYCAVAELQNQINQRGNVLAMTERYAALCAKSGSKSYTEV